jgi:hypothetical protein
MKVLPRAGDDEGWKSEDRACHERLADRGGRACDVLLQDGALEGPERGHRDDGSRERRRNGETRLHPYVGVRRPEHDRHQHPKEQRLEGELGHVGAARYIGLELLIAHPASSVDEFPLGR